jgi:hypothetical protein
MESLTNVEPQNGRTVRVGERDIYVVELGEGPPLVMLHGGGPGASGTSNFSRNIPALARRFRLIVPDLPGYGRSTKGLDRRDAFGDLAQSILGLLDALNVAGRIFSATRLAARARCGLRSRRRRGSTGSFCSGPAESTRPSGRRPRAFSICSTIIRAKAPPAKNSSSSCARTWCSTVRRCPTT